MAKGKSKKATRSKRTSAREATNQASVTPVAQKLTGSQGTLALETTNQATVSPVAPLESINEESHQLSPERVILMGIGLILLGMIGFDQIPGLIADDANGSRLVNAFYCSVITLTT